MGKYLMGVLHEATDASCINGSHIFHQNGLHFLLKADWGCKDDLHKAWMTVEVENKDQALQIFPSAFRSVAKIILLHKYT